MANETKTPKKRARRRILASTGPLQVRPMDGYHLRWAATNNPQDPLNIQELMERGYSTVTPGEQGLTTDHAGDLASVVETGSATTIQRTGRDGITLMLMKLPNEFYQEDLQDLKKHNDSLVNLAAKPKQENAAGLKEFGESVIDGKPVK
jgi:hypothetical protein